MEEEKTEHGILETWTPEEVRNAFQRGEIVLIDVRTPQEFLNERIPGAMNYPMQEFDPATLPGEAVKRIVFHCGSDKRSGIVARKMLNAGHPRVAHMKGGFAAWKAAGHFHITTDPSTGAPRRIDPEAT